MKAIVLAAGVGRRLGGRDDPKCLLPLGGRPLLAYMLDALAWAAVDEAVVVVGHGAERIAATLAAAPPPLPTRLVTNPRYREGAILSLHSAHGLLADGDGGVLVMDADVLFAPSLLADLVREGAPSSFLCDPTHAFTGEEMMLHGAPDRVTHIHRGVLPDQPLLGEAMGFLKLARDDARRLAAILERAVDAGRTAIEHEAIYDELLAERTVGALSTGGRPWTEIDFPEDLERAAREVLPAILAADDPGRG